MGLESHIAHVVGSELEYRFEEGKICTESYDVAVEIKTLLDESEDFGSIAIIEHATFCQLLMGTFY